MLFTMPRNRAPLRGAMIFFRSNEPREKYHGVDIVGKRSLEILESRVVEEWFEVFRFPTSNIAKQRESVLADLANSHGSEGT